MKPTPRLPSAFRLPARTPTSFIHGYLAGIGITFSLVAGILFMNARCGCCLFCFKLCDRPSAACVPNCYCRLAVSSSEWLLCCAKQVPCKAELACDIRHGPSCPCRSSKHGVVKSCKLNPSTVDQSLLKLHDHALQYILSVYGFPHDHSTLVVALSGFARAGLELQ